MIDELDEIWSQTALAFCDSPITKETVKVFTKKSLSTKNTKNTNKNIIVTH